MALAIPDFYPRSPRGERQIQEARIYTELAFLSTLPARGATVTTCLPMFSQLFLSTLPARGATENVTAWRYALVISIHAPREGSDSKCAEK